MTAAAAAGTADSGGAGGAADSGGAGGAVLADVADCTDGADGIFACADACGDDGGLECAPPSDRERNAVVPTPDPCNRCIAAPTTSSHAYTATNRAAKMSAIVFETRAAENRDFGIL